jgi:hypothetical protein
MVTSEIGEALDIRNDNNYFTIFRDHTNNLQYIRNNKQLHDQGMYVSLGAFKYHVFLDFREVEDRDNIYSELAAFLDGRGVPDIKEALQETRLQPVHQASRKIFNTELFNYLFKKKNLEYSADKKEKIINRIDTSYQKFLNEIQDFTSRNGNRKKVVNDVKSLLNSQLNINQLKKGLPENCISALEETREIISNSIKTGVIYYSWLFIHPLGKLTGRPDWAEQSRSWIDELYLGKIISDLSRELGLDQETRKYIVELVKILSLFQNWVDLAIREGFEPVQFAEKLLGNNTVRQFIGVNRYKDILWFNQESFEELIDWLYAIGIIKNYKFLPEDQTKIENRIEIANQNLDKLREAMQQSEYKVRLFLDKIK